MNSRSTLSSGQTGFIHFTDKRDFRTGNRLVYTEPFTRLSLTRISRRSERRRRRLGNQQTASKQVPFHQASTDAGPYLPESHTHPEPPRSKTRKHRERARPTASFNNFVFRVAHSDATAESRSSRSSLLIDTVLPLARLAVRLFLIWQLRLNKSASLSSMGRRRQQGAAEPVGV